MAGAAESREGPAGGMGWRSGVDGRRETGELGGEGGPAGASRGRDEGGTAAWWGVVVPLERATAASSCTGRLGDGVRGGRRGPGKRRNTSSLLLLLLLLLGLLARFLLGRRHHVDLDSSSCQRRGYRRRRTRPRRRRWRGRAAWGGTSDEGAVFLGGLGGFGAAGSFLAGFSGLDFLTASGVAEVAVLALPEEPGRAAWAAGGRSGSAAWEATTTVVDEAALRRRPGCLVARPGGWGPAWQEEENISWRLPLSFFFSHFVMTEL